MSRKRVRERSVVLPWEGRTGLLRRSRSARRRILIAAALLIMLTAYVGHHERVQSGVRATQASLLRLTWAIDAYRADHGTKCPPDLLELQKKEYITTLPVDAWNNPFFFSCPGRFDPSGYEVSSAGPDGIPGGLDRIE